MVKMSVVWDRTAEFLSDNLPTILPIALLAFFVPASIQGNFAHAREGAGPTLALVLQLLSIGFSILGLWGALTIALLAIDSDAGPSTAQPRSGGSAGAAAGRRLLPLIVVMLVQLAVLLIACAPVAILLAASGVDIEGLVNRDAVTIPEAIAWAVTIYLLVMLAALLFFTARFLLITPIVAAERRMLGALRRSFVLTRGITWPVIGVMLLYGIVSSVAIIAARGLFGSIFRLVAGGEAGVSLASVLTSVMVAGVQTTCSVIGVVFVARLYVALARQPGVQGGA